jgi:D-beta-D-heptose 7-phosphate kinase/D-beta-D-heptose 1-phosphate adenosyltransferase
VVAVWNAEPLADLAARCQALRQHPPRRRIAVINGCFDVLHPGHVLMIQDAASRCDVLVVAVDADAQVRELKGRDRPLRGWAERAFLVASIRRVFGVVSLGEGQPLATVLAAIKPDLYMHRAGAPQAEVDAAAGVGAQVLELPAHGHWSTTRELTRWEERRRDLR